LTPSFTDQLDGALYTPSLRRLPTGGCEHTALSPTLDAMLAFTFTDAVAPQMRERVAEWRPLISRPDTDDLGRNR